TRYPSTSASTTKGSSDRSRAGTGRKVMRTSTLHPSLLFSVSYLVDDFGPCLLLLLFADRRSAGFLFLFASRLLPSGLVCLTLGPSPIVVLSGSNRSCCVLFRCDSRNTCSGFLCWVLRLAVPVEVGLTDVSLLGSPEE
ncbi:hypothetical protein Tco_0325496, partial [Tanacetum coccineum]